MAVSVVRPKRKGWGQAFPSFIRMMRKRFIRRREKIDFLTASVTGLSEAIKSERAVLDESVAGIREAQADLERKLDFLTATVSGTADAAKSGHAALEETAAEIGKARRELAEAQRGLDEKVSRADGSLEDLRRGLAELQGSVTTAQGRAETAETEVWKLWRWTDQIKDRIEFVRSEFLFEMQSRLGGGLTGAKDQRVRPRTLDEEKLQNLKETGLRLNIGCGHKPLDGYLNVDARELPGVDMIADGSELPLEPGSVEEIFSAHMLEHLPLEVLRRRALPHWFTLLKEGGRFGAVVPDAEAMIRAYANDAEDLTFDDLRNVLFGEQDYEGDFHYTMFSQPQLESLLGEQGFTDITWVAAGRRNGRCLEMEVRAVKPGSDRTRA